jgi:hypothetical protein
MNVITDIIKFSPCKQLIITVLFTRNKKIKIRVLNLEHELPAEYGTAEEAPNASFEPLHELLVGLHPDFLPDLFAPAAGRNQWRLFLAAVADDQVAFELSAHSLGHGPAKNRDHYTEHRFKELT